MNNAESAAKKPNNKESTEAIQLSVINVISHLFGITYNLNIKNKDCSCLSDKEKAKNASIEHAHFIKNFLKSDNPDSDNKKNTNEPNYNKITPSTSAAGYDPQTGKYHFGLSANQNKSILSDRINQSSPQMRAGMASAFIKTISESIQNKKADLISIALSISSEQNKKPPNESSIKTLTEQQSNILAELRNHKSIIRRLDTIIQSGGKHKDISIFHDIEKVPEFRKESWSMWNCAERPVMEQIIQERGQNAKFDNVNQEVTIEAAANTSNPYTKPKCDNCKCIHNEGDDHHEHD